MTNKYLDLARVYFRKPNSLGINAQIAIKGFARWLDAEHELAPGGSQTQPNTAAPESGTGAASQVEPEAPRCTCSTEIRVVSIDPECPKGHGKGLPPRPLTVPAEPTEERPSQPLESSTVCTACQRVKDDTGNTRGWGLCHCGSFRHPTAIHL